MTILLGCFILTLGTYGFVLGPDHLMEWHEAKAYEGRK